MRMSAEEFAQTAAEAVGSIPPDFRRRIEDVAIEVEDQPSRETAREMGVPRDELLGAYFGTPLTERSIEAPPMSDRIVLYQRNIERMCRTRAEVVKQIRVTVLHEVGHFFGLSEDDLEERGFG